MGIAASPTRRRAPVGVAVRWLIGLESFVAVTAVAGGVLLMARPDGSLLDARISDLGSSSFADWLVPGAFLLVLVGGGFTLTALTSRWAPAWFPTLSVLAGFGLIVFEITETLWIRPQPLQLLFGLVGAVVVVLALRSPTKPTEPAPVRRG